MNKVSSYREFTSGNSLKQNIRSYVRSSLISLLSINKNISKTNNWISFPYYHHVFDDEVIGFDRQLKYFKNHGDFISIDQAHEMIINEEKIDGRYFCLSFDDGFQNCFTNMMDVAVKHIAPTIIYLATDYINLNLEDESSLLKVKSFDKTVNKVVPFLNWNECREMLGSDITFGSHTCGHVNLATLNDEQVDLELSKSKKIIEKELGISCDHFAAPWGRKDVDFKEGVLTSLAKKNEYKTVVTTNRGKVYEESNPYLIKRDHVLAEWGNSQLDYFFGK